MIYARFSSSSSWVNGSISHIFPLKHCGMGARSAGKCRTGMGEVIRLEEQLIIYL